MSSPAGLNGNMRTSGLRAEFCLRDGRTALADTYFTAPLKLAKPFPDLATGGLAVTVMDASPGMMDGDRYVMEWRIGPGASAAVTTQAYGRVHPCPRDGASQSVRIFVGEGASLVYAPQPAMLYADAAFKGSLTAELSSGASLIILDTLCAGRVHYGGEAFRYRLYENELTVIAQGKTALASRVRFAPGEQMLRLPGVFERDTHVGALYGFGPFAGRAAAEALWARAEKRSGVRCGVTVLAAGGVAAAVLGRSAWEVHETLMAMGRALAAFAAAHAPGEGAPLTWPANG